MSRAVVLAVIVGFLFSGAVSGAEFEEKWIYAMPNFANERSLQNLMDGMRAGAEVGVTHVQVKDPKFGFLELLGPEYFENINRVLELADELGMVVVPVIFPFGYSGGYLVHDPNLAAGLPVKDAPFIVRDGVAHADPEAAVPLVNGDFEGRPGSSDIPGWTVSSQVAPAISLDANERVSGRTSLKMSNFEDLPSEAGGNVSVSQVIEVEPFKYYRLTIWRKASDLDAGSGTVYVGATDGTRRLSYTHLEHDPVSDWVASIASDHDWQQYQITFNTLEVTSMEVRVSISRARSGAVWWDDLKIEPAGLANVLRRPVVKPLVVTSADGSRTYIEHRDFEPVVDPMLGNVPNAPGAVFPETAVFPSGFFTVWHEPPGIVLTPDSRIQEGEKLLVSYYHPHIVYGAQIVCSLIDPKIFELMDDQVRRVVDAFNNPKHIMFNHDEIRIGGWEQPPDGIERTPGEILALNMRRSVEIARKHAPDATLYTWSDMFDPNHNARPFEARNAYYHLNNGNYDGSWEGLPSEVAIFTWVSRSPSLQWFADRGHKQILCGYYDGAMRPNIQRWMTASEGIPNVVGMMYTTWRNDFSNVREFFRLVEEYPDWVE